MIDVEMTRPVSIKENNSTIITLDQNLPNPYSNFTTIRYTLTKNATVQFDITDVSGKRIKTMNLGSQGSGQHQIELNASEFEKGIYFYTLTADQDKMTKKMVVVK